MFDDVRFLKALTKVRGDVLFNVVLLVTFILSQNYLEEDVIVGLFSIINLLTIVVVIRESRSETLRQIRKRTKKVFRVQKILLRKYAYFSVKNHKIFNKIFYRLREKFFFVRVIKRYIHFKYLRIFLYTNVIFMKLMVLNTITIIALTVASPLVSQENKKSRPC